MIEKIKKKIFTDEVKKLLKYVLNAAKMTILIGLIVIVVLAGIIIFSNKFEQFIMVTDIKYNSPVLNNLTIVFVVAGIFVLIYGISLCLYKYKRLSESKNSYNALKEAIQKKDNV